MRRRVVSLVVAALGLPGALTAQATEAAAPSVPVVAAAQSPLVADVPGVRRGFVTVNGARLHYLDFGGSGEPVVLLAGLGNTAWIWSDFAPRLAREGFRVVALTRRAHGESEAPAGGYGLDTLAADVVAFMDSLGLRQAHLVGHSLAGAELTHVAARHPTRVGRLVYLDAAYDRATQRQRDEAVPPPEVAPAMTAADRASTAAYLAYQRRARLDLARFWGPVVERDFLASLVADSAGARWRHPFVHYGTLLGNVSRAAPEYAAVRGPALAVYATVPQLILPPDATAEQRAQAERFERETNGPWTAESIAQFQAGVRLGRVERVAGVHHLFLDRPEQTLRLVRDFLRGPAPTPSR